VQDDNFCIKLSYDGLSGPELSPHAHGPAAIGETGPVIFTMALTLTKDQMKDLDDELWYFNIYSDVRMSALAAKSVMCECVPWRRNPWPDPSALNSY
jgi:hypothetical protein